MYRQVLVHPDDAIYQKILFRSNPDAELNEYILNTVTYGTSCAPFLAIRTLHHLADNQVEQHPSAPLLKRDFYVDNLLTGANTPQEARTIRDDLIQLLKRGGFTLRKWASNELSLISDDVCNFSGIHMSLDPDSAIKTLGLRWDCRRDTMCYSIDLSNSRSKPTKRTILSQMSKLFDPLGLLGPVILKAKLMVQFLWKLGVSWDDRPILVADYVKAELHGFCDASEEAYGACVYILSVDSHHSKNISLVCSKSRVAPIKPLTLPRFELCAALLLARLINTVRNALYVNFERIVLWSDSTIALSWINSEPRKLKTFVCNRVTEIQDLTANCEWRHVSSADNPADLVSRGQLPQEFIISSLWKNVPEWL
ncbi:uncharacterized protein LOC117169929 [Belonocnema kinseyi]|uniref:uncharacterized protein LOC117169929 n=1 Tax=Belonocnema kinseyi TaxID=2817044 RepID=UPI00143D570A|nr:uncharacterized protein LOC117169929 [Belonocnema kinseyi]